MLRHSKRTEEALSSDPNFSFWLTFKRFNKFRVPFLSCHVNFKLSSIGLCDDIFNNFALFFNFQKNLHKSSLPPHPTHKKLSKIVPKIFMFYKISIRCDMIQVYFTANLMPIFLSIH